MGMRVSYSELNPEARPFSFKSPSAELVRDAVQDGDDAALAAKRAGRYSVNRLDFDSLEGEPHDVASFLRFLRLHKYIDSMNQKRITLVQLLNMSEDDLIRLGFTANGARKRLLTGILRYHEFLARTWTTGIDIAVSSEDSTDSSAPSSPDLSASPNEDSFTQESTFGSCLEVRSMPSLLTSRRMTNPSVSPVLHRRLSAFVDLGLPEIVEAEMSKQFFSTQRVHSGGDEVQAPDDFLSGILHFMETGDE